MPIPAHAIDHSGVGYDELVARAQALVRDLTERAATAEQVRRVPEETLREFHETGLFRILQPTSYGGAEAEFGIIIDVGAAIAEGCASSAWVLTNLAAHHWMLAFYPERAQRDVWDDSPDHLIGSAAVFPSGRAEKVDGGYLLDGRWPFSSGVDDATWNMIGALVAADGDGAPAPHLFLLPKSDYRVIDTWQVIGLIGTGSHDVEARQVFVPSHRVLAVADTRGGASLGSAYTPGPLYRIPMMMMFPYLIAGVALGNAQGAYDGFVQATRARTASYDGSRVGAHQSLQIHIAEAGAAIDAAGRIMRQDCAEAMAIANAGEVPEIGRKLRFRRDCAFAVGLCTRAVETLFKAAGGAAIYERNPIQRRFRDAHAIAGHAGFNMDVAGARFGAFEMGFDPAPSML